MDQNQAHEYINRINKVYDYIERNLTQEMTLAQIAKVAGFSEFHFHRLFAAMTGETLFSFIQRLRIEQAAIRMCIPGQSRNITQISTELGFSSSAVFSRVFKKHFGCTPSEFKKSNQSQQVSNLGQLLRNDGKANNLEKGDNGITPSGNKAWRFTMKPEVKVEKIEEMRVAYIRYVGPYAGDGKLFENLYTRLGAWTGPRGIDMSTSYIIYHDDPGITDEQKLRLSVCVPITADVQVSGEICEMTIGGGEYGVGTFLLGTDEYAQAWQYMFAQWLPGSGYQPADAPSFERYVGGGEKDGKMKVDICIPVKAI